MLVVLEKKARKNGNLPTASPLPAAHRSSPCLGSAECAGGVGPGLLPLRPASRVTKWIYLKKSSIFCNMTQALVLTPQSIFMIPTVQTCKLKTQLNGHFYKIR